MAIDFKLKIIEKFDRGLIFLSSKYICCFSDNLLLSFKSSFLFPFFLFAFSHKTIPIANYDGNYVIFSLLLFRAVYHLLLLVC